MIPSAPRIAVVDADGVVIDVQPYDARRRPASIAEAAAALGQRLGVEPPPVTGGRFAFTDQFGRDWFTTSVPVFPGMVDAGGTWEYPGTKTEYVNRGNRAIAAHVRVVATDETDLRSVPTRYYLERVNAIDGPLPDVSHLVGVEFSDLKEPKRALHDALGGR